MMNGNLKPVPKIAATGFGGAIGVIITMFVDMDPTSAAALAGALGTIAGYLMPSVLPWKKDG